MWKTIEVSAPGKLILHGEHAVVYGKAAIAVSLSLRTEVFVTLNSAEIVSLKFLNQQTQYQWSIQDLTDLINQIEDVDSGCPPTSSLLDQIKLFLYQTSSIDKKTSPSRKLSVTIFLFLYLCITKKYGNSVIKPLTISVDTELSIGSGMGSSASYAVSLAAAFLAANEQLEDNLSAADLKHISLWAFSSETIAHGHPSGIDNSICTYGGAILFKDNALSEVLPNLPLLKVLLVDSGVERTTSHLVSNVKEKGNIYPTVISHVMDTIASVSEESWSVLKDMVHLGSKDCVAKMQGLVKMNQHLLNCLDVGHPKLNEICSVAQEHGCAAKLTGSGGGGCAFIVLPWEDNGESDVKGQNLKQALSSLGYKFWDVIFGGPGVSVKIHPLPTSRASNSYSPPLCLRWPPGL